MNSKVAIAVRIVAILAAVWAIDRFAIGPWRCNRLVASVERRTQDAFNRSPSTATRSIATENLAMLKRAIGRCATDVDMHLLLSFNASLIDRREDAVRHLSDALKVDDRPELYFNRGMLLLEDGKVDAAVDQFAKAARFNPLILERLGGELRKRVAAAAGVREGQ